MIVSIHIGLNRNSNASLLTFSDRIQVSIFKDDWQGTNIAIKVCTFHWKWRQRQEVAGAFDSISHLLVTVSTDGGNEDGKETVS